MNKFTALTLAIVGSTALSANVLASSVAAELTPGINLLSDNSAEYLIKGANNNNATQLEVGDRLRGIFNIESAESSGTSNQIGANGVNELTGIFEIEVTNVVTAGQALNAGAVLTCGGAFCFDFGPVASFAVEMGNLGFSNTAGAMVGFFEDSSVDYNRLIDTGNQAADIAAMEATATDGDAYWLAGFAQSFDFWTATAQTNDIGVASIFALNTPFGQFALGTSLLDNPNGPDLQNVACTNTLATAALISGETQFCGNGGLLAKGDELGTPLGFLNTAYDSLDDVNFSINVVPAPASLALLGLGLVGMAGAKRRRNNG